MSPDEIARRLLDTNTAEDVESRLVPADLEARIAAAIAGDRDRMAARIEASRPHPGTRCGCGECTGAMSAIEAVLGTE